MVDPMDRDGAWDMFSHVLEKNYISVDSDLRRKIGRSANREGVSPLTTNIRQLITKKSF